MDKLEEIMVYLVKLANGVNTKLFKKRPHPQCTEKRILSKAKFTII
jgi:hypothetical protein